MDCEEEIKSLRNQLSNALGEHGSDIPEQAPEPNDNPAVWDLVIKDIRQRDVMGVKKYGTRLQPFNGRKPLWDAYQEALDQVVYLRQAIFEQDEKEKRIDSVWKMVKIQCTDGNWNGNQYMMGLANGLLAAYAQLTNTDPVFLDKPEIWLDDMPKTNTLPESVTEKS